MKIVFFVHCFFPDHFYGTETYTLSLARYYCSLGYTVTVVTALFQGKAQKKELINRYFWENIPVIAINKDFFPHSGIKETYYQIKMYDMLESIINELKPDVIHITHLINHTSVLLEVIGRFNIPIYTTLTDFFGLCLNNRLEAANGDLCLGPSNSRRNCITCYLKDSWNRNYENSQLRKVVTSSFFTNLTSKVLISAQTVGLLKNSHFEKKITDIIQRPDVLLSLYNRYYTGAIAPTDFIKKVHEKNGIKIPITKLWFGVDIDRQPKPLRKSDHEIVVGYIGQIAPHKGVDLIIKAFKRLPKNSAILKIYGNVNQLTTYMKELETLSEGMDNIFFMGTFDQSLTARIFRDMDLFVIPSRWYENSPLVLLNSLATHTPVLISNVEGMTEFLTEGKNGYSFKRGSVHDLTEKLTRVLQTPGLLNQLSLTTEYVYTTEFMAEKTLNLYRPT